MEENNMLDEFTMLHIAALAWLLMPSRVRRYGLKKYKDMEHTSSSIISLH